MDNFRNFIMEAIGYSSEDGSFYIHDIALVGALKKPELVWLSKNWEHLKGTYYFEDDTVLRLDVMGPEYREFREILGLPDEVEHVFLSSKTQKTFEEFVNVFLNKKISYNLRYSRPTDMYSDPVYKKRKRIIDSLK